MNNIDKEIKRRNNRRNKSKERKVYKFKDLQTNHIALYPLMVIVHYSDVLRERRFKKLVWNEERTERILNYIFPKIAEISDDGNTISKWINTWRFWFDDNAKFYDKKYCRKFKNEILDYLFNRYEIEGYNKEVITEYEWKEIVFTKK